MPSLIGRCGGGGSGIQFDTSPQEGDWLEVGTTSAGVAPSGWGIQLYDRGGDGISLAAINGGSLDFQGAGYRLVSAGSARTIVTGGALSSIQLDASAGGDVIVALRAGQMLRVRLGNADLFEVRADGSIHGQAAIGAITWDL